MTNRNDAGAEPYLPDSLDHEALARAAADCRGCSLYGEATSVVVTYHPAAALRDPGTAEHERIYRSLVEDLQRAGTD